MSEHKYGNSNWSAKQKKDYWDRRQNSLRGQIGHAIVVKSIYDGKPISINGILHPEGKLKEIIPISGKHPAIHTSPTPKGSNKVVDRRFTRKGFHPPIPKKVEPYLSKSGTGY